MNRLQEKYNNLVKPELVNKFNIKKAPTLLVPKMGGYDVFENVSFIKQFIESRN